MRTLKQLLKELLPLVAVQMSLSYVLLFGGLSNAAAVVLLLAQTIVILLIVKV